MTNELNYSVQGLELFKSHDKVAKLVYFNNTKCSERPYITEFNPVTMMAYCMKKLVFYDELDVTNPSKSENKSESTNKPNEILIESLTNFKMLINNSITWEPLIFKNLFNTFELDLNSDQIDPSLVEILIKLNDLNLFNPTYESLLILIVGKFYSLSEDQTWQKRENFKQKLNNKVFMTERELEKIYSKEYLLMRKQSNEIYVLKHYANKLKE